MPEISRASYALPLRKDTTWRAVLHAQERMHRQDSDLCAALQQAAIELRSSMRSTLSRG